MKKNRFTETENLRIEMIALKSFGLDQSNSGKLPTIKTSRKGNCRKGNVKKSKKLMKIVKSSERLQ